VFSSTIDCQIVEFTDLLRQLLVIFCSKNMEVLKPEVYWIGSRCYRKNPSKNKDLCLPNKKDYSNISITPEGLSRSSSGTAVPLAPYVEEDTILCKYR